jgi:hypothetical protein
MRPVSLCRTAYSADVTKYVVLLVDAFSFVVGMFQELVWI